MVLITNATREPHVSGRALPRIRAAILSALLAPSLGCFAIRNGWLDPTVLGNFGDTGTMEIRASLTLEDSPFGIPGAEPPSPEDSAVFLVEHSISPGDRLAIEVFELRQPLVPFQVEVLVAATGFVNLPVVGRVRADGRTVEEFELAIVNLLRERSILVDPEVTVNSIFLQNATYSIFGIGVSAANNAPLRAGTFPIRRPGLRVLEAINQVGGLNEFVTDIYVFRYGRPARPQGQTSAGGRETTPEVMPQPVVQGLGERGRRPVLERAEWVDQSPAPTPEEELMAVVLGPGEENELEREWLRAVDATEPVEPWPTQPYIWVNGEFIRNPAYKPPAAEPSPRSPPSSEAAVPAVDWDRIAEDVSYRIIRISADLLRSGDPQVNIVVRAGDVIRILSGQIGLYYVMGQVNRVGAFSFNAEEITLKAAIAAAGGLSGLAWPDRCTVYRRIGQREQMIQVDLDRIFAGKDADFYIKRGDIINVGTHPFAPFLQRLRALTLPNPTATVGYSFVYSRNFADIDSFSVRTNPHNEPDQFPGLFP